MKKRIHLFALALIISACSETQKPLLDVVNENLDFAAEQYKLMAESDVVKNDTFRVPRSTNDDGSLRMVKPKDWTSGFYPGVLWYLYEHTNDPYFKANAEKETEKLEELQHYTGTHDLGFMIYCSYGNAYRITNKQAYADVMVNGANALISRFDSTVGLIRSWDHGDWQYPVIIDNMMNLEYLFWASEFTGDPKYKEIAITHADVTMKNHYRDDYSTWHVVDYDTLSGKPLTKMTHQGAHDTSSWARGQAWGLYGYTLMYRFTKDEKYLDQAQKIANYILNHPSMPEDLITYWDYTKPGEEVDQSAAALVASCLLELSEYVSDETKAYYMPKAETIVRALCSPKHRAELGENNNFILKSSVGSKPHNSEVAVPINYADYYFIEALLRYKKILQ